MAIKVVSGGCWPRQRKHEANSKLAQDPWCDLCSAPGAERVIQDEFHLCWECPAVHAEQQMADLDDQRLVAAAKLRGRQDISFWTRGFVACAAGTLPEPPAEQEVVAWPASAWRPGVYFTDASGGARSARRLLRRVGFAAVMLDGSGLDASGRPVVAAKAFLGAGLAGRRQTVNRGELQAIISVLEKIDPQDQQQTIIYSDSFYCVRGARLPSGALALGSNADLWRAFHAQMARHQGRVIIRKAPAHKTIAQVRRGQVPFRIFWGNLVADRLAAHFAAQSQVPEGDVKSIDATQGVAGKVLKHCVNAMITVAQLYRRRKAEAENQPARKVQRAHRQRRWPDILVQTPSAVHLSNGHALRWCPGALPWKCSVCLRSARACHPRSWKKPCCPASSLFSAPLAEPGAGEFPAGAGSLPLPAATLSQPAAGDLDDADRDPFLDLDAFQQEEEEMQQLGPEDFPQDVVALPPSSPAERPLVEPCLEQGVFASPGLHVREFPRQGEHICIGGARLHVSHKLRYNRNWLWCVECGAYSGGGTSKLLFRACGGTQRRESGSAKHSWKRLSGNKTPLRRLDFADGAQGFGWIVAGGCGDERDVCLALVDDPLGLSRVGG